MKLSLRPYATAGVALVGAGVIAISPVAPPASDIQVASSAVQLSAFADPFEAWLEVFDEAGTNLNGLADAFLEAPFPILQQVVANQLSYLGQLPDLPAIFEQVLGNLEAAIGAPFAADPNTLGPGYIFGAEVPGLKFDVLDGLSGLLPDALEPLLNFTGSSTSGVLLGLVGPVVGPVLALTYGVQSVVENLMAGEFEAAFGALIDIPATVAGAFLNGGQTLDLTPLVTLAAGDLFPEGSSVGLVFGGLLSPGGSLFNALDIDAELALDPDGPALPVYLPGQGPGFKGSLIGLTQAIARAIGWAGPSDPSENPDAGGGTQSRQLADGQGPEQIPASNTDGSTFELSTKDVVSTVTSLNGASEPRSLKVAPEAPEAPPKNEAPEESLKTGEQSDPDEGLSAGQEQADNTPTKNRPRFKRFDRSKQQVEATETAAEASAGQADTTPKKRWNKKKRNGGSNDGE